MTSGLLQKMNRVELEGVIAHELSHIRNYDILVSTLAVTLVGAIALITDTAIRLMWWNGGRVRREGDRSDGVNPLAFLGFALLIFAPILAKIMQATISRQRETLADVERVPDDPVSAGADRGAREAARRHDGDPLGLHRHRAHVDRAAAVRRRRPRQVEQGPRPVLDPSATRGADRALEGAVIRRARAVCAAVLIAGLLASACSGGDGDSDSTDSSAVGPTTSRPTGGGVDDDHDHGGVRCDQHHDVARRIGHDRPPAGRRRRSCRPPPRSPTDRSIR